MLTEATIKLLTGIYQHEGILSQRQIIKRFFPGKSKSWPEARLQHYFDHHLVNKFNASFVNGEHLKEIVFTLDTVGARYVAREVGLDYESLTWRKSPRWLTLSHDLKINDFRIAVTLAAKSSYRFKLVKWISEYELSQRFKIPGRLDGFLTLRRQSPTKPGKVEELAILPEIDNANHPLGRFIKKKVKPALSFIGSFDYEQTFGVTYGACFVITTGPKRLENLKAKTEEVGGRGLFYFTTFDQVSENTVLTAPIWAMAGSEERFALTGLPLEPRFQELLDYAPQGQLSIPSIAI